MPRNRLGPRLYLDPKRKSWVIRNDTKYIRLGLLEHQIDEAKRALADYENAGWCTVSKGEHVYFIKAAGKVKIGRTENVKARLTALQRMSPVKLQLLWAQPGDSEVEASYHRRFSASRVHGEWFEISGSLKEFLTSYGVV